jgi:hypothetical protein
MSREPTEVMRQDRGERRIRLNLKRSELLNRKIKNRKTGNARDAEIKWLRK